MFKHCRKMYWLRSTFQPLLVIFISRRLCTFEGNYKIERFSQCRRQLHERSTISTRGWTRNKVRRSVTLFVVPVSEIRMHYQIVHCSLVLLTQKITVPVCYKANEENDEPMMSEPKHLEIERRFNSVEEKIIKLSTSVMTAPLSDPIQLYIQGWKGYGFPHPRTVEITRNHVCGRPARY